MQIKQTSKNQQKKKKESDGVKTLEKNSNL